jgi:hypothetical protein
MSIADLQCQVESKNCGEVVKTYYFGGESVDA